MAMVIYRCLKCGAMQSLPDIFEDNEPCMFCGGDTERKE
jgi:DNA-directed RNA polymerase subunit RPC12/RpoP